MSQRATHSDRAVLAIASAMRRRRRCIIPVVGHIAWNFGRGVATVHFPCTGVAVISGAVTRGASLQCPEKFRASFSPLPPVIP